MVEGIVPGLSPGCGTGAGVTQKMFDESTAIAATPPTEASADFPLNSSVAWHAPPEHIPPKQSCPHTPQFFLSVSSTTHELPQAVCVDVHPDDPSPFVLPSAVDDPSPEDPSLSLIVEVLGASATQAAMANVVTETKSTEILTRRRIA
jgi:hypothetical protein